SGIAVVGGRLLASRISERQVAIAGGVLFLVFALSSLLLGVDDTASASSSMRGIADEISSDAGDSTMDGSTVHHRSVRWEEIPQAVTMAALIDLMRRHGFDYGGNVRSINWPFDRGSPHGSAIIRFESHDLAKRFILTFDGYTWSESATRSRLCWSPERIDQLPGALARPASSTAVVVRGVPSNCTYGNLHRFMKRFFGPVVRCKLGPRDGRSYRHVICVFATVGAARSALKCSRMAAQGNRKSARVLKSLGGNPVTIEPHGQEGHWGGDDHSDTTEPSTPGGDSEPSDEAWTVDKTGYGDDSSDDSSPRKASEETAGLLANPEPCATLMWYHVPHNCTPDKLMRLLLDYGCQLGPVSAYRSCDLIIDEYSNHAMVHCVSWEKARALMMALESFPGLLGEYGSMEVIDGKKDTLFLDAMEPCWGKDTNRTIVVLNMFTWLSRNEFIRIVSHFGDVRRALVRSYISCGRITTYGLCHFVHRAAASLAAEVGRVAPTELGVGYRTTLSMLGQRVRLKLLTWLVGNEWYFEMNRRRQQAQSWPTFQGYYYWSSETMAPAAIEGPPTPVESEENKGGVWYERRPRFDKNEKIPGSGDGTRAPSTDSSRASSVAAEETEQQQQQASGHSSGESRDIKSTVLPAAPPLWCGGYREVTKDPLCIAQWPQYVREGFLSSGYSGLMPASITPASPPSTNNKVTTVRFHGVPGNASHDDIVEALASRGFHHAEEG
ncbi:hypothetical protein FOZ63_030293, partial [Perkinsus olseni]